MPFETTITTELALLHLSQGIPIAELRQMTLLTIERSFALDDVRAALRDRVAAAWPQQRDLSNE